MALSPFCNILKSFRGKELKKVMCGYLQTAKCNNLSVDKYLDGGALSKTTDDLAGVSPYFQKTFNIAAYVNKSETLQNLVHLNVDLNKIEKKPYVVDKILRLDFEKNMKGHISFLNDHIGIDQIGHFVTKNPLILCEPLADLYVRVNYLESKGFSDEEIKRIITRNPFWLMFSTVRIDKRLGYFQKTLDLQGIEVRQLATKQPKLITYNLHHIRTNLFVLKEEMGFEESETKYIVMEKPKILMLNQKTLLERFNYIHNTMKISHALILKSPGVLFCRNFKLKQRHLFLVKLGRAQYDPTKENYVPLLALVDKDADFCKQFAKCTVDDYNMFLKTL